LRKDYSHRGAENFRRGRNRAVLTVQSWVITQRGTGCGEEAQEEAGFVGIIILLVDQKSFDTMAKRLEKQGLARALLSKV
jgi:hypothetical protein